MKLLYRGLSLLDRDSSIIVVMTGASNNRKTGPMNQIWILCADKHPLEAVRDRSDFAICGNCALRDNGRGRVCYVPVQHAPAAIYRSYRDGMYEDWSRRSTQAISYLLSNQLVRVGAYGDPAAVAVDWWRAILLRTSGHTAYTHHWKTCDRTMREIAMASVDTMGEYLHARSLGYRTYRVRTPDSPLHMHESPCPASNEMNHCTTCHKCLLCDGKEPHDDRRRNISILVHRTSVIFYRSRQQAGLFEE